MINHVRLLAILQGELILNTGFGAIIVHPPRQGQDSLWRLDGIPLLEQNEGKQYDIME